jgi:dipeptidyl aminopeptidase/acylaminoacyl peptidase
MDSLFGPHDIDLVSRTADENTFLVRLSSDVEPGEFYWFDRSRRQATLAYRERPDLPRSSLSRTNYLEYASSDGLRIPAYLTLPQGQSPKRLGLIVLPHGGPWGHDHWGFNAMTQFLANRGCAVLQPNYRGSTGIGKRFTNAGNFQMGALMQDDITWGVRHLIEAGIADAGRVGILGYSFGGYLSLAGAAFTPDLYAAAVSVAGPANLLTLLDGVWERDRAAYFARVGDPSKAEDRARLARHSPLFAADAIRCPLLIAHGNNDPRVKRAESDQMVEALRSAGKTVTYLVAPDEGHGFVLPQNDLALMFAIEEFFAKHLCFRCEEPDQEILGKLRAMTVSEPSAT